MLSWTQKRDMFAPLGSTVQLSCTSLSGGNGILEWSINFPDRETDDRFNLQPTMTLLNNRGFYQLSPKVVDNTTATIWMFINNTSVENNGTMIKCTDFTSGSIAGTTLITFGECH